MDKYKILDNYQDLELLFTGQNFLLYKGFKDDRNSELLYTEKCFLIKLWPKIENQNDVIKELWLDEIRQLQSLKNYPAAREYLIVINNAHYDEECYCIIYECDEHDDLLSNCLEEIQSLSLRDKKKTWLNTENLLNKNYRIFLWENILKIASGISILHINGLLHRKITTENIIVNKNNLRISQFRLTGFEWLLSLHTLKTSSQIIYKEGLSSISSYNEDWYHLGKLIQNLLGIDGDVVKSIYGCNFLTQKEFYFLKELESIYLEKNNSFKDKIIDEKDIIEKLDKIIFSLKYEEDNTSGQIKIYDIAVNEKKIQEMLGIIKKELSLSDDLAITEIFEIIEEDLDLKQITIIRVKDLKEDIKRYCLQGKKFYYEIIPTYDRTVKASIWGNIALINRIMPNIHTWHRAGKNTKDFKVKINIVKQSTSLNLWSNIIDQFEKEKEINEDVKKFLRSMLIYHAIEISEYWTNVYLVSTNTQYRSRNDEGAIIVTLDYNRNTLNQKYSNILNKKSPTIRFRELMSAYDGEEWVLSTKKPQNKQDFYSSIDVHTGLVLENDFKVIIRLRHFDKNLSKYYFYIKNDAKNPNHLNEVEKYVKDKILYLYPKSLLANYTALIRRSHALTQLARNESLISSIIHMETNTSKIKYANSYIGNYDELDDSKKEVYEQILETYPNFIVQGPPGVGKTFLITSLLEQIFHDEAYSKVILSAQSHSTVQVLFNEIKKCKLPNTLIKLDTFNNEEDGEEIEDMKFYEKHTKDVIKDILDSPMWKISHKNQDIIDEIIKFPSSTQAQKSLYKHVLSSANIILTTTNSATIETLIRNYSQFDWTILEESGKASGIELISPLLLSSKRLLIGDHKQLPPFSEQDIETFFINPNLDMSFLIKNITEGIFKHNLVNLTNLDDFVESANYIKENILEDTDEFKKHFTEVYYPVIEDTRKYFSLFKYMVENVEKYRKIKSDRVMGNIITEQYRMHPDISKIISNLFYNNLLGNNPEKKEKYENILNRPFNFEITQDFIQLNINKGFVWLDICEPNNSQESRCLENNLSNIAEIFIIEKILQRVKVINSNHTDRPTIMILTPYNNQLNNIRNMIKEGDWIKKLHDKGFNCTADICKTVDSFQGGEADLVIVSLVRHNIKKKSLSSLGFLLDERRMNVMLSRAKYQMFVIGSIGMFEHWAYHTLLEEEKLKISLHYPFVDKLCKWVNNEKDHEGVIEKVDITTYISNYF